MHYFCIDAYIMLPFVLFLHICSEVNRCSFVSVYIFIYILRNSGKRIFISSVYFVTVAWNWFQLYDFSFNIIPSCLADFTFLIYSHYVRKEENVNTYIFRH